jgi:hypothetical protein
MTWPTLRPGEEVMLGVREGEGVKEGVPVVVVLLVGLGVGESEPVGVPETLDPAEGVGVWEEDGEQEALGEDVAEAGGTICPMICTGTVHKCPPGFAVVPPP